MSLNNSEWSQIESIQMSVQTADLFLLNNTKEQQLSLSCTLLTIARGKCNVEINQYPISAEEAKKAKFNDGFSGGVIIPRDRPVMQCQGVMPPSRFKALTEKFISTQSVGRPITVTLHLKDILSVSVNGDLYIEDTRKIIIEHIDFAFPLR